MIGAMPCWSKSPAWLPIYDQASLNFIVFEVDGSKITKKMAAYHQFHAVNKAIASTIKASSPEGDKRVGVVWHTQGSGKSLSMVFYAGKIIRHPAMQNPTLV